MQWTQQKLEALRDQHDDWLMRQPFISGTGIGLGDDGHVCIKIYTNLANAQQRASVRERLGDAPLRFEETGQIKALGS